MATDEPMKVPGELSKQFGVSYGGDVIGDWDTAKEAWQAYRKYEDVVRPVTDPKKKYRYGFRNGRDEIRLSNFERR